MIDQQNLIKFNKLIYNIINIDNLIINNNFNT